MAGLEANAVREAAINPQIGAAGDECPAKAEKKPATKGGLVPVRRA
jgi:hypothetical protein